MESESESDEDDSDDEGPEAGSSKVPVKALPSYSANDAGGEGEGEVKVEGAPSIHPSRMQQNERGEDDSAIAAAPGSKGQPCRNFRRGHCPHGATCLFLHTVRLLPSFLGSKLTSPILQPTLAPTAVRKRPTPALPPPNPFARPSDPFSQLAERDISRVMNEVLQVVEFLAGNDWLDWVELKAGEGDGRGVEVIEEVVHVEQADEGEKVRMIEELPEVDEEADRKREEAASEDDEGMDEDEDEEGGSEDEEVQSTLVPIPRVVV